MRKVGLEICLDSPESALIAEQNGATRVELCDNLIEGGTTPSAGSIAITRKLVKIPIHVMIRPRGGDFRYSDTEFEVMKYDIQEAKRLGANGVVIGLLNPDGSVDVHRTKKLVELAKPLNVTFHRAFDMTADPFKALEDLISIGGIQRVLTSGQDSGVLEGLPLLTELVQKAGNKITILPGCGITVRNLDRILAELDVPEVHMAIPTSTSSKMTYRNGNVFMGVAITTPEYSISMTDGTGVNDVSKLLGNVK
ncbi:hypothetical protein HK097_011172 [Rhizophlyctis rosea]|uniref:Copper homeostasis protein cutC homolog n=1 Tax=Rhizophlyctis rosea TaxID=64517 RepID=A0AAD5SL70_9FUNG|nr:hypothetical protein HK097_011172 [Rhizophlyctis rosea]